MKVAVFSSRPYDQKFLQSANTSHELTFYEARLTTNTTALAQGFSVVCAFVHDHINKEILTALAQGGTQLIALRCAGFNNVDLIAAEKLNITVVRVPAYSPYAVAEHTVGLILALNRKIHRAYARVREGNFALESLMGFDLHGQTVGVVGTGNIGIIVCQIMRGFGCRVLAYDPYPKEQTPEITYVSLQQLLQQSDIVTLHCPLTPQTHHMIDAQSLEQMKTGVMLINTSRGALVDTQAVIKGLKSGKIGYLGLDVYEEEADLFFEDLSSQVIQDDLFARLLTFPNVIITGHQAFFTRNAMQNIAETTIQNISDFEQGKRLENRVSASRVKKEE